VPPARIGGAHPQFGGSDCADEGSQFFVNLFSKEGDLYMNKKNV